MANQVVKVRAEALKACMTCPLCDKLFIEATTISECLHTFCRKCIYDKITEEDTECCPVCYIDLGCTPLEKLRLDHNLQDVRAKIFPLKRRKVNVPEVMASATPPARRKERSLSSLVVSTPRVSSQGTSIGRRTKAVARKASDLQGSSFLAEREEDEDESGEDHPEIESSLEDSNKSYQDTGLSPFSAEPTEPVSNKDSENGGESWEGKLDLWKPLNYLVEAANRTKSHKPNSQGSERGEAAVTSIESPVPPSKTKANKQKPNVEDGKNTPSSCTRKPKKLRVVRPKRESLGEASVTPQAVLDAANGKVERRVGPIWFSLVASEEQEGEESLPQIPTSYLRIKDGSVPVSFIQKYLMKKLNLNSETEVEIKCMGEPVVRQRVNACSQGNELTPAHEQFISSRPSSSPTDPQDAIADLYEVASELKELESSPNSANLESILQDILLGALDNPQDIQIAQTRVQNLKTTAPEDSTSYLSELEKHLADLLKRSENCQNLKLQTKDQKMAKVSLKNQIQTDAKQIQAIKIGSSSEQETLASKESRLAILQAEMNSLEAEINVHKTNILKYQDDARKAEIEGSEHVKRMREVQEENAKALKLLFQSLNDLDAAKIVVRKFAFLS